LLADPDSTVRVAAAFALGLLRDSAAVQPIIDRLTGLPGLDAPSAAEAVTALAKIGGLRSGEFFGGVLGGRVVLSQADPTPSAAHR
jgi:HEAT repeat protein